MGGTLPAASRAVETRADANRRRLAVLYGANTLGAVAGVIVRSGAAVGESRDGRQRHGQDVVTADAIGARGKADPAGVALAPGIE